MAGPSPESAGSVFSVLRICKQARDSVCDTNQTDDVRDRLVTVLPLTFEGLPIQCKGGQYEHSQTLPAVPCVSRSKVMEMEEHPPSWGKPQPSSPSSAANVRFRTSVQGRRMAPYGGNGHRTVEGWCEAYTCCTTGQIPW